MQRRNFFDCGCRSAVRSARYYAGGDGAARRPYHGASEIHKCIFLQPANLGECKANQISACSGAKASRKPSGPCEPFRRCTRRGCRSATTATAKQILSEGPAAASADAQSRRMIPKRVASPCRCGCLKLHLRDGFELGDFVLDGGEPGNLVLGESGQANIMAGPRRSRPAPRDDCPRACRQARPVRSRNPGSPPGPARSRAAWPLRAGRGRV